MDDGYYEITCPDCKGTFRYTDEREDGFIECLFCANEIDIEEATHSLKDNLKVEITFDKDTAGFIMSAFVEFPKVCGFCQQDITTENLAGIVNKVGFVCNGLECLIKISDSQRVTHNL